MFASIPSLVPNPDDLLALEVEELAGVLLTHLNSHDSNVRTGAVQLGQVNQYNFFNNLRQHPDYPGRQPEVSQALVEAWAWLESEGILIRDADQSGHSFFLSRRGIRLKSRPDFSAYRKASLLPKGQLHPLLAAKVYPAFLRGEYDTAVFQAFREVEVSVRAAGQFEAESVGQELMRDAFRPANPNKTGSATGTLTDSALPIAEQEAMMFLFSGAIGLYKNPQSHRNVPTDAVDAVEVILFASHLLRMIDRLRPPATLG
jgi:uncharacterized protein (TIGR02391 family)